MISDCRQQRVAHRASGGRQVVYSFHVASLGESFIYDPQLAQGQGVREATNTEAVPVEVAKK